MRFLAEIGAGGVDGQRCVTLVRLVSHTEAVKKLRPENALGHTLETWLHALIS